MKNLSKNFIENKAPVKIEFVAKITNEEGEVVAQQNLTFESPAASALHEAINSMGKSFLYGLGIAASEYCDTILKKNEKQEKKAEPAK